MYAGVSPMERLEPHVRRLHKGDVPDGRGFQWTADEDLELLRVTLAVGVVAVESTNSQTHIRRMKRKPFDNILYYTIHIVHDIVYHTVRYSPTLLLATVRPYRFVHFGHAVQRAHSQQSSQITKGNQKTN